MCFSNAQSLIRAKYEHKSFVKDQQIPDPSTLDGDEVPASKPQAQPKTRTERSTVQANRPPTPSKAQPAAANLLDLDFGGGSSATSLSAPNTPRSPSLSNTSARAHDQKRPNANNTASLLDDNLLAPTQSKIRSVSNPSTSMTLSKRPAQQQQKSNLASFASFANFGSMGSSGSAGFSATPMAQPLKMKGATSVSMNQVNQGRFGMGMGSLGGGQPLAAIPASSTTSSTAVRSKPSGNMDDLFNFSGLALGDDKPKTQDTGSLI